jgi:hypothetical protein
VLAHILDSRITFLGNWCCHGNIFTPFNPRGTGIVYVAEVLPLAPAGRLCICVSEKEDVLSAQLPLLYSYEFFCNVVALSG